MNITHLIQEYKTVPHGEKAAFFERIEKQYGISKDKFHRLRRKKEGKLKSVERKRDLRKRRLAEYIVEMKERGKQRSDKPRELPTELCIDRLVKRGIMDRDELSPSHANYILRTEFQYREETPRVRWEAEYALQEVQADGSISKYFRPWKNVGNDVLLKASGRPLAYKDRDAGSKLILWQFQDKFSRLRTVRGFPGMAESTPIFASHMQFWLNREADEHPMKHLPWELAHDNGSLFKTQEYKNLALALGFAYRTSKPYEKTGIGSVERMWQEIWKLELVWSEDYPTILLSEYNMLMHEAMIAEQKQKHPTMPGYKGEMYQKSLLRQKPRPREMEADVMELMHKTYERTVTNELSISVEGQKMRVPQYVAGLSLIGEQIHVHKNWRGQWAASVDTENGPVSVELRDFEYRSKGEFSGSHTRTFAQRMKHDISEGNSMYDSIMSGRVELDSDGEPFDSETGELLHVSPVKRLEPKKEIHRPETPFTPKEETIRMFDTVYDAKVHIGKRLKGHGLTYTDVSRLFDGRLEDELELNRDRIDEEIDAFLDILNHKTKTA